jgi:hypothetical protein
MGGYNCPLFCGLLVFSSFLLFINMLTAFFYYVSWLRTVAAFKKTFIFMYLVIFKARLVSMFLTVLIHRAALSCVSCFVTDVKINIDVNCNGSMSFWDCCRSYMNVAIGIKFLSTNERLYNLGVGQQYILR